MEKIYYTSADFGLCKLLIAAAEKGVCKIDFGEDVQKFIGWLNKNFRNTDIVHDNSRLVKIVEQLQEYFDGRRRNFNIELDLIGTAFQKKVWRRMISIPYGEIVSYKTLAEDVGGHGYCRAVGNAANKNNLPIIIPCHRVIGSNGNLTGFASGLELKARLIQLESGSQSRS